jgi:hypothetical protein
MADLFSQLMNYSPSTNSGTDIFQPNLYPQSYSGINPEMSASILSQLAPLLTQTAGGLPNSINQYGQQQGSEVLQSLVNNLAGRNMVNSSVASDTLGKGLTGVGTNILGMQTGLSSTLGSLIQNLGGYSYTSNPLAPYSLLSNFVSSY